MTKKIELSIVEPTENNKATILWNKLPKWFQTTLIIITETIICIFLLIGSCIWFYNSG